MTAFNNNLYIFKISIASASTGTKKNKKIPKGLLFMTIFVEANAQKHVFSTKNDTFQKLTKIPINHEISLKMQIFLILCFK
jgi:hypothetical protein